MESDEGRVLSDSRAGGRVPLELIGEGLLLAALLIAPWLYGSVEDTARYALCAALLLACGLLLWPDLGQGRVPRGVGLALAFPAFALTQLVTSQSMAPLLTAEAAIVGFCMAMVAASIDARAGSTSTHTGRRLAVGLLLLCGAEAAFAAFQWSTDRTLLFGSKGGLQTMPFGSYVNHNNFAGLVSLGAPLAIAMAIGDLRRSGKLTPRGLTLMGLAFALVLSVLASGSRGGALALGFGLMSLVGISRPLRRQAHHEAPRRFRVGPLVLGVALLVVAALSVPAPTRTRLANIFQMDGSTSYRVDIGLASLRAFCARPLLGSGLGAFADAVAPFKVGHGDVRSEHAEADLVEFAVEGGLVLIGCLLVLSRFVWRSARHEMVHARDRGGRWLRAGALASCITMLFHSLFDFGFRIPANALAFAVLLGLATAGAPETSPGHAFRSRALITLLLSLAIACAYRSVGAAGERAALARATPESRLDALQPLVDAHPYLDNARRQRGLSWMTLAYSRGRYDATRLQRAHADLQIALNHRPQWAEARADLAWVKFYQGGATEARAEMRLATELDPTHIGIGIAYAQLLAWSSDLPAAIDQLSRLRRLNPVWSRASALEIAASWTKDPALFANIP